MQHTEMTRKEFETIYRTHYGAMFRVAFLRLRDADDAREVVQDAMMRLWQRQAMPDNVAAFLRMAVLNGAIDRLRAIGLEERAAIVMAELAEPLADEADREDVRLKVRRMADDVLRTEVSEPAANAFNAVFRRGLSYDEAAHDLGVSRATVNKHVVNVLRKLRCTITLNRINDDD